MDGNTFLEECLGKVESSKTVMTSLWRHFSINLNTIL